MSPEQPSQNNAPDKAQNELTEKVDALRQNQDIEKKAQGVVRAVVDLKNSINKGSMQVVLKDPVGNLGEASLNENERSQFRTELLQILKDMDPERLNKEVQKFSDKLKTLSSKIGERIKGNAGEKIQQSFEQEKEFSKMGIASRIKDYKGKREAILHSTDISKASEQLAILYKESRVGLENDITKVDAYLENRDITPQTKADAIERKYAFTEMIAGLVEQTNDGFAIGQIILLDGQNLEGKNIGDLKASVAEAYESYDGPGGSSMTHFDQQAAANIRKEAGKISVLAIDPIKGIQLSGSLSREGGVTHADKTPTWYRPEQLHELKQNGWLSVGDKDGKTVAFEAQDLIEKAKSLELSAQVEREKGGLLQMTTGDVFPGMNSADAGKKIATLLPGYSGIELNFDQDGKMKADFTIFDQLNPQKKLEIIATFKTAILVAKSNHQIEHEPDMSKQQFYIAEKNLIEGKSNIAIPLFADFIKTVDSTKVISGTMPEDYKKEMDEMRKTASEYVETAKKVSLQEFLQVARSIPEEAAKEIHEFQATAIKEGSIEKALGEVKSNQISELIKLALESGASGEAGKNENYEKMADILMNIKAYDAAKFYYERAISGDASNVRSQLKAENGEEKINLKESNEQVLKMLNQQIDQWLKSNNVTLNFDQLQNLRGEMFKQFTAQEGVPDEKVYQRMVKMSDGGLIKSSAWDKYREHFDPGNEIINLSAKSREFVIKKLPIIAAEIGILIVAPHIGAALAAEYVVAMEGAGAAGAIIAQLTAGTVETISTFVAYEGLQRGALPILATVIGEHETAKELRHVSIKNLAMDFALTKGATYLDHLFLSKILKRGAHGAHKAGATLHSAEAIAATVEEGALLGLSARALSALRGIGKEAMTGAKAGAESLISHDALPHGIRHFMIEKGAHPIVHDMTHKVEHLASSGAHDAKKEAVAVAVTTHASTPKG